MRKAQAKRRGVRRVVSYLKISSRSIFGIVSQIFCGYFYNRDNAQIAREFILSNSSGHDIEVISLPPNGCRLLTWQEWMQGYQGDPRPYLTLDTSKTRVDVKALEAMLELEARFAKPLDEDPQG
jgi:hypothetical protein